jgi:hypothetical protein
MFGALRNSFSYQIEVLVLRHNLSRDRKTSSSAHNFPEHQGLLYIVVMVSSFLFGWFSSRHYPQKNCFVDANKTQDNTRDEASRGQNIAPAPVRTIVEPVEPPKSPPEEDDAKKKRKKYFNKGVKIVTISLLLIVAGINGWQLSTQIRAMKIDQRPWVVAEDLEAHIWQPNPGDFYFIPIFANVGKSPAINIDIRFYYKIVPKVGNDFPFGEYSDARLCNGIFSGAFNPTPSGIRWPTMYCREEISYDDWQALRKQTKRLYFLEDAEYTDVFNRPLYTHFCAYYISVEPRNLRSCDFYTDTKPE